MAMFDKKKGKEEKKENGTEAAPTPTVPLPTAPAPEPAALATLRANPLEAMLPMDIVGEKYRPNVMALLAEMNPVKRGFDEASARDWVPQEIRIRHALTRNAPAHIQLGELYTTAGDKIPTPFCFTPLFVATTHIKFEEGGGARILCMSPDTKTSQFGTKCDDCIDFPFRDGRPTGCVKTINAIVASESLGLYMVRFAKTSYKAGAQLSKMAQAAMPPWTRWYNLNVGEETNQSKAKYYVLTTAAAGRAVEPLLQVICDRLNLIIEEQHKTAVARIAERAVEAKIVTQQLEADAPVGDDEVVDPDFSATM